LPYPFKKKNYTLTTTNPKIYNLKLKKKV